MTDRTDIHYHRILPDNSLSDFIQFFWCLTNPTAQTKLVTILPDGYFDILAVSNKTRLFHLSLVGLGTEPVEYRIPPNAITYAISFKLLAAEYLLQVNLSTLINKGKQLPDNFWNLESSDLSGFKNFVDKATTIMMKAASSNIDQRKKELFDILYASNGSVSVKEMSDATHWNSRQINRYFKSRFGISLKTYCSILRYRASFEQLKEGQLYPGETYFDQPHFIKEVKKYSGVTPKELVRNKNDRFIQFSTLPSK